MSNTPSKEEVRWCSACGEGVTFFCRSKIDCVCPQALVRPASSSTPSDTEIARLANENARLKASQPVVREPLTDAQIKELIEDGVFLGNCKEIVKAIERAHGIKGGQHG